MNMNAIPADVWEAVAQANRSALDAAKTDAVFYSPNQVMALAIMAERENLDRIFTALRECLYWFEDHQGDDEGIPREAMKMAEMITGALS